MGEVYRAYDTTKGRMVAVKILRSEMAADPSFQERFRRESRMAARLQEPHCTRRRPTVGNLRSAGRPRCGR